jgi:cytochrome c553
MNRVSYPLTVVAAACAAATVLSVFPLAASADRSPQQGSNSTSASVEPPPWAYTVNTPTPPDAPQPQDDGQPKRVPGSNVALTLTQLRDLFNPPDWHPNDHPAPPEVVAHGRKPDVRACGYCHYPNGQGRPENASLAGLPAAYIVQQMADLRSGARKSAEPKMRPPAAMIAVAKASTVEEDKAAAEYFAALTYKKWIRVVETATIAKMRVAGGVHVPIEGGGTEPLGSRIVETPEDIARADLRDSASGFIAYVPVGSIKRGRDLATTGGAGKTVACGTCHGADLKGLGPVPPLAGRSATHTVRQLFDFKQGARSGVWAALMKGAVEKLTVDDMIAIAAYTASLEP